MNRMILGIALVAASLTNSPEANASIMVEYSWSGTILVDSSDDPWGLGSDTDYSVSILVDGPDLASDVNRAEFSIVDMQFSIDGVAAEVNVGRPLEFQDAFNRVLVKGARVSFNGVLNNFRQEFRLPANTFSFSQPFEVPPTWGTAIAIGETTSGFGSSYDYRVPSGAPITANVIPEPTSLICWSLLGILGVGYRRRKSAA